MTNGGGGRIGPYEIVGWLGAGAMGEVYRARDPRLGRDVALKVIAEASAADAGRLQRFAQEARAAGQLDHPNVLAVHDVGTHDGAPYIVSELLEGESLRRRLQRGALPVLAAIDYVRQATEGLAAAHARGIVHRDVKPENLFVTHEGRLKILDFGIAKLGRGADRPPGPVGAATDTEEGAILGTTGYMSPEQVRGETVDARSDIFSVGTILHEMLTGRPPFLRHTAADTMSAVLKEAPQPQLGADVQPALRRIVSRCLEKARDARFQSASDLAFALADIPAREREVRPAGAVTRWRLAAVTPWVGAAGVTVAVLVGLPRADAPSRPPMRLNVELGGAQTLAPINAQFGDAAVLSPDGTILAFVANASPEERSRIHVRRLDQLTATPLSGTEDAVIPFFSPDGRSLAFFARGTLKTIALAGGTAVSLAPAPDQRGGAWAADGTIVFAPNKAAGTGLLRISSLGGTPEALNALDEGEVIQLWPQVLAGGRAVLYTSGSVPGSYNDANLIVQPLPDGPRTIVHRGGFHGRYLASGHLVYIHDGTLFAVPFDLRRLQKTGPPVAVVENVASNTVTGGAQFSVSDSGTLLFLSGPSIGTGIPLEWMDRTGATMPLRAKPANWFAVRFSPDGNRLALEIRDESADIWIYELTRGRLTRLTSGREQDNMPVWTPDARRLTYASARGDGSTLNLYWQRADGTGTAERLTTSGNAQQPTSWHPGGRFLAFDERTTRNRIMILPLDGNEQSGWKAGIPVPFSNSAAQESQGVFSPDGRWLAYSSNDTGRPEIYVRPFPGPGARAAVSAEGGMHPTWSHDGRQLFFGNHGQIMVAPVIATEGSFETEKPRLWSGGRYQTRGPNRMFDLHPDGRFALASDRAAEVKHDHVVLMFNFFDELRRIAPPSD